MSSQYRRPHESLARLAGREESLPPGTLRIRSLSGGVRVPPRPGRVVRFGRGGTPRTDFVPVGGEDQEVSRVHGTVTYQAGSRGWWLRNTGQQLLRLAGGHMMHTTTGPFPLAAGYTPVFVRGTGYREHLVELYVTDYEHTGPRTRQEAPTVPPKRWALEEEERLVLIVLGQDYIRYRPGARPLVYRRVVEQLNMLRAEGERKWTKRRVEEVVGGVRRRLHASGRLSVDLVHDRESGQACDSTLMHNLLTEMVNSTTLVPPDLEELERKLDL
ncbi:FHA domain-containing protein [Streptomyces sp. 4N509B]|uniref:FHA domain-containing protein n=1 Tax=Streptomyces sp. 4N509B TaxID=3457413 RepID=UPI003FCF0308